MMDFIVKLVSLTALFLQFVNCRRKFDSPSAVILHHPFNSVKTPLI